MVPVPLSVPLTSVAMLARLPSTTAWPAIETPDPALVNVPPEAIERSPTEFGNGSALLESLMLSDPVAAMASPDAAVMSFAAAATPAPIVIVPLPAGMQTACAPVGAAFVSQLPGVFQRPPAGPV